MKVFACLILMAVFAPMAMAGPDDVRVALALASASRPASKATVKPAVCQCANGGTCICADGKCDCAFTAKTADPKYTEFLAWKKTPDYKEYLTWKSAEPLPGGKVNPELSKPYAKAWQAQGWTYDESKGYWTKPAPQPATMHSFVPMRSFGGFGSFGGGGGCSSGGCR